MRRGRGETKVDLRHLLEDLRDAYPGGVEETILTEIVANSLDARATCVAFFTDTPTATLHVVDDGCGMLWKELRRLHDLAASSKTRGEGIGFAGVGLKLALLVASEVITETRRGKSHVASRWHLASRERAPYEPVPPPGAVAERGTAVHLVLDQPLSPLLDPGFIEHVLRQHYQPLLDPPLTDALRALYPSGIRFEVNGRALAPFHSPAQEHASLEVRIERQRKPSGIGYIERHATPLPEHMRGIAISTYGKVIRRGWDWLGLVPATPEHITGIIEIPALAAALTLNKGDFIRTGTRGGLYLSYRRAIQEAVQARLAEWGDARDLAQEGRRKAARPLERDLERVIEGLSDAFPLLASLVEHQRGGQKRIALAGGHGEAGGAHAAAEFPASAPDGGGEEAHSSALPEAPAEAAPTEPGRAPAITPPEPDPAPGSLPASAGGAGTLTRRGVRYGLSIQFEAWPGDTEMARLIESTVWVNTEHPAWKRAETTRATQYHVAVAVALALAPLATGGGDVQAFLTAFLTQWGEAIGGTPKRARRG